MASIVLERGDVIVGVDTHKHCHVAVAVDGLGQVLSKPKFVDASTAGYGELLSWADSVGDIYCFGIEGCGSYGSGLAKFLRRRDYRVEEVTRPPRKGERRARGKSDTIDAEHAARTVLTARRATTPKIGEGQIEAIRLLKIVRDAAVKQHSTAIVTLKAVLVTAEDGLRETLEPLTTHKLVQACAALNTNGDIANPEVAMRYTLQSIAQRYLSLHEEIKTHTTNLKTLTNRTAPQLLERFGIGFDTAAELLIAAGDNTDRIHSEAAFARLCGACPIPTGSGKTSGRHRLNRSGNRQANAALYRIVISRIQHHQPTINYIQRRTAQGLTKKDIIRCLKRYVAREVYQLLPPPTKTQRQPTTTT